MSKPEKAPSKEPSRDALPEKLVAHSQGEAQLERLEEFQRLLLPVKVKLSKLVDAAISRSDFTFLKSTAETLANNAAGSSELLGVSKEQFVTAALRHPSLFYQKPETLANNVARSSELMGVSKEQFVTAALKQPSLFYQKPKTLADNVARSSELLVASKEQFVTAALKQPPLFYLKPETIAYNVVRSSELLGVSKEQFVNAALILPQLFYQKPQTLSDNVARSSELLGVSKEQFVTAALKKPQLFNQKPKTLAENVLRSSDLLGVSKEQFVTAALRQPQLFCRKPETLAKHGYYIKRIMTHLEEPKPFGEFIAKNPVGLTFANENLLGRAILAQQNASPTTGAKSLIGNVTKKDAQAALVKHYTGRVVKHVQTGEPLQAGERMIQTLHHIGVLDALPEGMEPLKDERSISMLEKLLAAREAEKAKQKPKER